MSHEKLKIRKIYTIVDQCLKAEFDKEIETPLQKVAVVAVIENPFAGVYTEDIELLYEFGEELGELLSKVAIKALNVSEDDAAEKIDSYGKTAIVGENGELEHGHAVLHPRLGAPLRNALGGADYCRAVIPASVKMGSMGAKIDIPLQYKNSEWVFSHIDTMEVNIPDAPKANELCIGLAMAEGERPLARINAGLQKHEVNK